MDIKIRRDGFTTQFLLLVSSNT